MTTQTPTPPTGVVAEVPRVILRSDEAAKFLGMSHETLSAYRKSGDGPPFRKVGKNVYYSVEELTEWVMSRPAYTRNSDVPKGDVTR